MSRSEHRIPTMDEPDRSSTPPQEADDQPPPSRTSGIAPSPIELDVHDVSRVLTDQELITLQKLTLRVLGQLPNTGSVRVRIVSDQEMVNAHDQFCGLSTTTDVLTFDLAQQDTNFDSKVLDTDLIVCVDEAQRQASTRQHIFVHELLLYIIHGVLHCLGHDDHDDDAFARMHTQEDKLLTSAGIGAIFSSESTPSKGYES